VVRRLSCCLHHRAGRSKAHATTTALWMRSYGSVLVRVPAFGWTSGQPFPTVVTALRW
jgi:hypothetical protein